MYMYTCTCITLLFPAYPISEEFLMNLGLHIRFPKQSVAAKTSNLLTHLYPVARAREKWIITLICLYGVLEREGERGMKGGRWSE
jgi:hypothetical protein